MGPSNSGRLGVALSIVVWGCAWVSPRAAGHDQDQGSQRPPEPSAALAKPSLQWGRDAFLGQPDAPFLDRLRQGEVVRIKKGSGGRSLGFKLYFADGTKAYFKPDQAFSGTNWYAEVASYHLDRLLGMGRVPPVVAHRMDWQPLRREAGSDRRVKEIHVAQDGSVLGALTYWLPQALRPAETPAGWENWIRVEPYARWSVTPFQRASSFSAGLKARKARMLRGDPADGYYKDVPEVVDSDLPPALSDMLVLDFLTLNIDRWGGDNTNVLVYGDQTPQLIFLDNAAGFSHGPHRRGLMDSRLEPQQKFRRATVQALRKLSLPRLRKRLSGSLGAPVLDDHLLEGIEVRRRALLARIDQLVAEHGEGAVLAWP